MFTHAMFRLKIYMFQTHYLHVAIINDKCCRFRVFFNSCGHISYYMFQSQIINVSDLCSLIQCFRLTIYMLFCFICCSRKNRTSPPRAAHMTPQSVVRRASQSDMFIDNGKY
jgi:hypothetical protein